MAEDQDPTAGDEAQADDRDAREERPTLRGDTNGGAVACHYPLGAAT